MQDQLAPQPLTSKHRRSRLAWLGLLAGGCAAVVGLGYVWNLDSVSQWRAEQTSTPQLEQAVKAQSSDPWPAYTLGTRYAKQNRLPEAMDLFERARNLAPNDYRPHLSMGLGFLRLGSAPAAVPELEQAARCAPRESRVFVYLGLALRSLNRYQEAVAAGLRSTELQPKNAEAWYQLGVTYYRPTGRRGEGRKCLDTAVRLNPNVSAYHRDYAQALSDAGEYVEAVHQAREAVRLQPDDPVSVYLLGKTLHRGAPGKDTAEAEQVLRRAAELSPTTLQPHYELGVLLEEKRDYAGALPQFELCTRLVPRNQQAWFHLSSVAERLGRKEVAQSARARQQQLTRNRDERQFLERRLFDHPRDTAIRLRLAALLERDEAYSEAAELYQQLLAAQPYNRTARESLVRLEKLAAARAAGGPQK